MKLDSHQIKQYFKDKPVLKAYLFGCFSREQASADSDIDILVELDYSQKIGLKFFRMQTELKGILNHKVDLVSNGALSPLIKPQVIRDIKLVYKKSAVTKEPNIVRHFVRHWGIVVRNRTSFFYKSSFLAF